MKQVEFRDYLQHARRWAPVLGVGIAVSAAAAFFITREMTPVYRANAIVLVNETPSQSGTYQEVLGSQQLANTYARLAVTDTNLGYALELIDDPNVTLESLREDVRAVAATSTQLIDIFAENSDPALAAEIANAVANSLPAYIVEAQLAGGEAPEGQPLNTVFVAQEAAPPDDPVSPDVLRNVILGMLAGAIVIVAAITLIEFLTDGLRSVEDIEMTGAPALGVVWEVPTPRGTDRKTWHPTAEADVSLRESLGHVQANLAFAMSAAETKVLLVTSPRPGDGKTTVAANLAPMIAQSGKRVLLIDGDLRKPSVHRYAGTHNAAGLSSAFLLNPGAAAGLIRSVNRNFDVLTAGPPPPNPMGLLGSARLDQILDAVTEPYDLVIVDSPPTLGIADASLWAGHVDGILLVARRGQTTRSQLRESITALRLSQKPILGVILNGARREGRNAYYYEAYASSPGDAPRSGRRRLVPQPFAASEVGDEPPLEPAPAAPAEPGHATRPERPGRL